MASLILLLCVVLLSSSGSAFEAAEKKLFISLKGSKYVSSTIFIKFNQFKLIGFQASLIRIQIKHQPVRFRMFNIFNINQVLLFEAFSMSLSYFIVLVQFEMEV
jgi:7tm Chemosensory receptor